MALMSTNILAIPLQDAFFPEVNELNRISTAMQLLRLGINRTIINFRVRGVHVSLRN